MLGYGVFSRIRRVDSFLEAAVDNADVHNDDDDPTLRVFSTENFNPIRTML